MSRPTLLIATCLALLGACNPAFNWRDVRPEGTPLAALLPCKPDQAKRSVPLGGRMTELTLLGCDAGGATFAIAVASVEPGQTAAALAGWQTAALANIKATGRPQSSALKLPGAAEQPAPVLVVATGQRADGRAVQSHAAYFAHGAQVFQAAVYADKLAPEVLETFFSGLKMQAATP